MSAIVRHSFSAHQESWENLFVVCWNLGKLYQLWSHAEWKCIFCNKTAQHTFQAGSLVCFRRWCVRSSAPGTVWVSFCNLSSSKCLSSFEWTLSVFFPLLPYCKTRLHIIHKAAPGTSTFLTHNENGRTSSSFSFFHSHLHLLKLFFYTVVHFFNFWTITCFKSFHDSRTDSCLKKNDWLQNRNLRRAIWRIWKSGYSRNNLTHDFLWTGGSWWLLGVGVFCPWQWWWALHAPGFFLMKSTSRAVLDLLFLMRGWLSFLASVCPLSCTASCSVRFALLWSCSDKSSSATPTTVLSLINSSFRVP